MRLDTLLRPPGSRLAVQIPHSEWYGGVQRQPARPRWGLRLGVLFALLVGGAAAPATAQTDSRDFADLSMEELLNETVTSASKKPTSILRAPTAITVVTQEDIRRLGITTLPEALRWAAGLEVARVNAHTWAISARGFQGVLGDKLQVMIDGRTIYEFIFAGVNWDAHDLMLEDVDRIEVIRGPGAALWGANAVNGVVNVITKSSAQTQGTLVALDVGSEERPSASVRYGGTVHSGLTYRVYGKAFERDGGIDANGHAAPYQWSGQRGGFRLDWDATERDSLLVSGDLSAGDNHETVESGSLSPPYTVTTNQVDRNTGANLLGRWGRKFSPTSDLSLQASVARNTYPIVGTPVRDEVVDVDLQHRFAPSPRQDVIWGLGTRLRDGKSIPTGDVSQRLFTAFVQDQIALSPAFDVILGTKIEHNNFTGLEWQPSLRLLWLPTSSQTVWAAASRAVRTPDPFENGGLYDPVVRAPVGNSLPIVVRVAGQSSIVSEELLAYELGYRVQPTQRLSFDLATFVNHYDNLIDLVAGTPFVETTPQPTHLVAPRVFKDVKGGISYGAELAVQWEVSDRWRLAGDYSWLRFASGFQEDSFELDHPTSVARLRSYLTLTPRWEINGAAAYTGHLQRQAVPGYLRFDLGVVFHPRPGIDLGIWGQNLGQSDHVEFHNVTTPFQGAVSRTALVRLAWRW